MSELHSENQPQEAVTGRKRGRPRREEDRYIDSRGYWMVRQSDGSFKAEHRMLMESALGRQLQSFEKVVHADGDKLNNDLSNLMLMGSTDGVCKCCRRVLRSEGPPLPQ